MFKRSEAEKAIRAAMRQADKRASARNATPEEIEQASADWHQLHDQEPDADYYRAAYGGYEPDWIMEPDGVSPATRDRYLTSEPGSPEHRAAYVDMHRELKGNGFPGPDADRSYAADHGYESPEPGPGYETDWSWTPEPPEPDQDPEPDHELEPGA
jgi:hypothetical protein